MATSYATHYNLRQTPQSEPIPSSGQTPNAGGGYAWPVDDWVRLDRFLILGSEGGSYYASERELTRDNANSVLRCLADDGPRVVNRAVAISQQGRAAKNDPALFVMALAMKFGDPATRAWAGANLSLVARTGSHLFLFAEYARALRGWGRVLKRAVANWYLQQEPEALAYQMAKYQQRRGWSHHDLLHLCHAKAWSPQSDAVFHWVKKAVDPVHAVEWVNKKEDAPMLLHVVDQLRAEPAVKAAVQLIGDHRELSWEMVPTELLGHPEVWGALLPNLPMTALLRNLGRMTANGLLRSLSPEANLVCQRFHNPEAIRKARLHPLSILLALGVYRSGHGVKGTLTWTPVQPISDALEAAFYLAFGNVTPTGKRTLLALDVSGSMTTNQISGVVGVTPREAAAALALVTARTEPNYHLMAFADTFRPLGITAGASLREAVEESRRQALGATNCALPMIWAQRNQVEVDTFVIYTDNETNCGMIHPAQALREYRGRLGIPAKMVVVAMSSGGFSIADPQDAGMLDVVGLDSNTPQVISDFSSG